MPSLPDSSNGVCRSCTDLTTGGRSIPVTIWYPSAQDDPSLQAGAERIAEKDDPAPPPIRGREGEWVVHVPAFADEMNKSRHLVARQAVRLASSGMVVIVPDLCGTGESPEPFSAATWSIWREEVSCIVAYALDEGATAVSLWGLRLGCVLAADVAARSEGIHRLLLWASVPDGARQVAQFLRLLQASTAVAGSRGGSVAEARAKLEAGEAVEVGGYSLSPALYLDLMAGDYASLDRARPLRVDIIAVQRLGGTQSNLESLAARWREQGHCCTVHSVAGPAFWATQELAFLPELLDLTTGIVVDGEHEPQGSAPARRVDEPPRPDPAREPQGIAEGITFACEGSELVGRLHHASPQRDTAVVIVVGGPQYRVGSHRQFHLLAQHLAEAGYATLRFDYRGMGDSDGELRGFADIGPDIRAAVDALCERAPGVTRVVLWGLCDAATAAAAYAAQDRRIVGLVLANPWVFSEAGAAEVRVKRYYFARLASPGFWKKLVRGEVKVFRSLREFAHALGHYFAGQLGGQRGGYAISDEEPVAQRRIDTSDLPGSFAAAIKAFSGHILLLSSGQDFTVAEFWDAVRRPQSPLGEALDAAALSVVELPDADHTFSRQGWRERTAAETVAFLQQICAHE